MQNYIPTPVRSGLSSLVTSLLDRKLKSLQRLLRLAEVFILVLIATLSLVAIAVVLWLVKLSQG